MRRRILIMEQNSSEADSSVGTTWKRMIRLNLYLHGNVDVFFDDVSTQKRLVSIFAGFSGMPISRFIFRLIIIIFRRFIRVTDNSSLVQIRLITWTKYPECDGTLIYKLSTRLRQSITERNYIFLIQFPKKPLHVCRKFAIWLFVASLST